MPTRKASAAWEGDLRSGRGTLKTETGAASGAYSFTSRFEQGPGTNPEELLAAAHAACYAMALSGGLGRAGKQPAKIEADAACTVEKVDAGFKVTKMHLVVRAAVKDIADDEFQQIAAATKDGCPISGAIKGNVAVTLDAKLV
ncbi:MAG: peroxiredoxin [Gemmatimonadetes bacterium GWC2_71_10]|nr:MAG: peroxiredoxin [Gemmatimonadetes bacterium GWC2_71_10]